MAASVYKHSNRVNFFFVISGKKIPTETIPTGLRACMRSLFKYCRGSVAEGNSGIEVKQIENSDQLPCTQQMHIQELLEKLEFFFVQAGNPFNANSRGMPFKYLFFLLVDYIPSINLILNKMNNTWLEGYGAVKVSQLQMFLPSAFLEVVELGHKFIDLSLKPLTKRLRKAKKITDGFEPLFLRNNYVEIRIIESFMFHSELTYFAQVDKKAELNHRDS